MDLFIVGRRRRNHRRFPKKKKNGFESTLETATLRSAHGSRRPNESKMRKKARSIETKEMSIDRERERERERDRPVAWRCWNWRPSSCRRRWNVCRRGAPFPAPCSSSVYEKLFSLSLLLLSFSTEFYWVSFFLDFHEPWCFLSYWVWSGSYLSFCFPSIFNPLWLVQVIRFYRVLLGFYLPGLPRTLMLSFLLGLIGFLSFVLFSIDFQYTLIGSSYPFLPSFTGFLSTWTSMNPDGF